jgi:hypothetical protein
MSKLVKSVETIAVKQSIYLIYEVDLASGAKRAVGYHIRFDRAEAQVIPLSRTSASA